MKNNIGESLIHSLKSNKVTQIIGDLAEASLDNILDDGFIKELPVFGTLLNIIKTGYSIRDKIFAKKILKFLIGSSGISSLEREDFFNRINEDNNVNEKLGETLIVLLDRIEDLTKAEMLGRAFKSLITNKLIMINSKDLRSS